MFMISRKTLRELINHKLRDADILLANRRYAAAIYLAGYALELALKLKICKIFKLAQGFPETKQEFNWYQNSPKSKRPLAGTISQLKEIRNHDLNKLLFYSGVSYKITTGYFTEWNTIVAWDPEMRYRLQKIFKMDAVSKLKAIKTLVKKI